MPPALAQNETIKIGSDGNKNFVIFTNDNKEKKSNNNFFKP